MLLDSVNMLPFRIMSLSLSHSSLKEGKESFYTSAVLHCSIFRKGGEGVKGCK